MPRTILEMKLALAEIQGHIESLDRAEKGAPHIPDELSEKICGSDGKHLASMLACQAVLEWALSMETAMAANFEFLIKARSAAALQTGEAVHVMCCPAYWPKVLDTATTDKNCSYCGQAVWWSPASDEIIDKHPDAKIVCLRCAPEEMVKARAEGESIVPVLLDSTIREADEQLVRDEQKRKREAQRN